MIKILNFQSLKNLKNLTKRLQNRTNHVNVLEISKNPERFESRRKFKIIKNVELQQFTKLPFNKIESHIRHFDILSYLKKRKFCNKNQKFVNFYWKSLNFFQKEKRNWIKNVKIFENCRNAMFCKTLTKISELGKKFRKIMKNKKKYKVCKLLSKFQKHTEVNLQTLKMLNFKCFITLFSKKMKIWQQKKIQNEDFLKYKIPNFASFDKVWDSKISKLSQFYEYFHQNSENLATKVKMLPLATLKCLIANSSLASIFQINLKIIPVSQSWQS